MKYFLVIIAVFILALVMPTSAFAQTTLLPNPASTDTAEQTLAGKIQSGQIHLSDIPAFIVYFINFGIVIAGSLSLLFLVIGGYRYIIGGIMQSEREEGKNTVIYAIIGLVVSLLAWAIVNIVQLLVT